MNKRTLRSLAAACTVLVALISLGCGGRNSRSGYCPPYNWYADQSITRISGSGANVTASTQAVKAAVKSGQPFNVTDNNTGRSYTIQLSASAAADLQDQEPCPAVAEIMAVVNARPTPAPTVSAPTSSNPGSGTGTGTAVDPVLTSTPAPSASATPLTGALTLYPGDYTTDSFKSATLTLARPAGFDVKAPAVYVFHGLTLDTCTVTLDKGQTVIYVDGNLDCKSTTWNVPGSGSPAQPDARNLLILGTASCTTVNLDQCLQLTAGIYAPEAQVTIERSKIFGGAVGRTVSSVDSTIQYDPHLRVVNYPGLGVASARWIDEKNQ